MATEQVKPCLPAVTDLVEYLRRSGTGQYKLDKLTELGRCVNSLDEFLEMAPNNVPAATMQKVDEYLGKQVAPPETKGKKPADSWANTQRGKMIKARAQEAHEKQTDPEAAAARVETRDNQQSSIPDHTILVESRAPVLKAGEKDAKPVGADVRIPEGDSPKDNDDAEGSEEDQSEVADMNADEAKDAISRMRSKDKLENIVLTDKRKTVQDAAQKRLDELGAE